MKREKNPYFFTDISLKLLCVGAASLAISLVCVFIGLVPALETALNFAAGFGLFGLLLVTTSAIPLIIDLIKEGMEMSKGAKRERQLNNQNEKHKNIDKKVERVVIDSTKKQQVVNNNKKQTGFLDGSERENEK